MTESDPQGARTVRLVVYVLVPVISLALLAYPGWRVALGFAGGALVGAGMLGGLVFCAEKLVIAPAEQPRRRWPYVAMHLAKFPGALAVVLVLVLAFRASVAGVGAGYGTVLAGFLLEQGLKHPDRRREPPDVT